MDTNRLTQRSQEALHDAQTAALRFGHTEVDAGHLLLALLDQPDGLVPQLLAGADADVAALRRDAERELSRRPKVSGPGAATGQVFVTQRLSRVLDAAEREAKRLKDEYVGRAPAARARRGGLGHCGRAAAQGVRRHPGRGPRGADQGPRQPAGDLGHARVGIRGPGEVRAGPHRRRAGRAAGPGHRAGRRDPAGHSDPVPQVEEQPRADRRPGRRQDRNRRGPGPPHRARRRAGGPARQDGVRARPGFPARRRQVPGEFEERLKAVRGFDPVYGARPLRRFIAREVETRIGRALLGGDLSPGGAVRVDVKEGELVVDFVAARTPEGV
jgi:hypothetical protein